jgi:TRAP-type uncharacterized transport system substrate-binding protein
MSHKDRNAMRRTLTTRLALLIAVGALIGVSAQTNGIAAKRPIFGGACPTCPWGSAADAVKAAMKPYGYDVQVCYYCAGSARAARLVADGSNATPPQRPTPNAEPTPEGKLDFGATGSEFLEYAWRGIHDFAKDKEGARKNLRLLAHLQSPSYYLVAVNANSGITDLRQIVEKKMKVNMVVRGGVDAPINAAVMKYYGLSDEIVKSFGGKTSTGISDEILKSLGGTAGTGYARPTDVDVIIGYAALVGAPEYAAWYDVPQHNNLTFLDIPEDLRTALAKDFYLVPAVAPAGLFRGMTRRITTVARDGTVIYGRDDMPDSFAYDVAKALDEQKAVLQWSHMGFSYNEKTVWKNWDVPLHQGAAKYYKERGYMK